MSVSECGGSGVITVLHVDDDPELLEVAAEWLEREDDALEVLTAGDASAALERFEERDVDCVVSDHDMTGMNGLELLAAVQDRDERVPFILFTGKGSEEVASEAVGAGVTDYLQKETGTDQYAILANRIRNAVEATRSRETARRRAQRFEQVLSIVPTGILQVARDGEVVFANERARGTPGAKWVVTPTVDPSWSLETLDGDQIPEERRPFRRVVDAGDSIEGVRLVVVSPAGEETVFEVSGAPLFEGDEVESVVFATTDVTDQLERERTLRRTTEQLELVLDNAPLIVAALDEDGIFRQSSGRGLAKLGLRPGEVVGDSVFDVYAGNPEVLSHCRRALDGERLHRTTEVEDRTFEIWYEPVADARSTDYSVVVVSVDITDRMMRQRELERYETVVETSGDPVYALDTDGQFTFVNDSFVETTGYDRGSVRGEHASLVMDEEDVERGERLIRDLLSSDRDRRTFEMTVHTADGDAVPVENHLALLPHDEQFRGTVGVLRNIAERKRHESTLEALNRVAKEIQHERTVEGACERAVTTAENLFDFNMCSILVREGEWLLPYAVSEEAPPDSSRPMRVDQGVAGETFQTGESYVLDEIEPEDPTDPAKPSYRSGLSVPVGEYGVFQAVDTETGAFDERDRTLAELLSTHAATAIERIEREENLTRQNERLEEFVGLLSHDVRNPLNVAAGHLELVREECDSEHLERVERAHERVEQLVEDMLALAGEGKSVTETEPISLADLVSQCWAEIGDESATLEIETEAIVAADPNRLRQLIENLLRNAVEHGSGDDGPQVTIGDLSDRSGFYVEDDGPGIPPEEREEIFEAEYSTSPEGTGFGLRIVEWVADVHGWTVTVTEGRRGGARFEISGVKRA